MEYSSTNFYNWKIVDIYQNSIIPELKYQKNRKDLSARPEHLLQSTEAKVCHLSKKLLKPSVAFFSQAWKK